MTAAPRPVEGSPDRPERSATEVVATGGAIAALVGAVPIVGPALLAGCLSCVGIGTAAGIGATSALPPAWWVLGVVATGLVVAAVERHRACRCQQRPRAAAVVGTVLVVGVVAWVATRYLLVPLADWATGPDTPPADGPILP